MTIYQTPPPDYAPEVALPPEGAYIRPSSPWYGRIPQYGSYIRHDSSPLVMLVIGFVLGALVFGNFINFPVFLDSFRSGFTSVAPVRTTYQGILQPDHNVWIVQTGDNLSQIADREYHSSQKRIQVAILTENQLLSSDQLKVGQALRLPVVSH